MPVTLGAVLAGGASRRFGSPKCLARLDGVPLVERVLRAQRQVVPASCIVTNEPELFRSFETELIPDEVVGRGPAAGIHAALIWARGKAAEGVWCSPCDAPFLDPALGRLLIERCGGADAVIPRSDGPLGYEPLFGWYAVAAVEWFGQSLRLEEPAMHQVIGRLRNVRYLAAEELQDLGIGRHVFTNINTREELLQAERKEVS